IDEHSDVIVHLHTAGGSVFDGNLIYTTLANSKANIQINIDGLAASMGSIIMLAGKKIAMSSNAFIMVHAPSGSVNGTHIEMTSAAKLLQSLEKVFVSQYSKKTGKTVDELKAWMLGDNWFSAEDALEAGLIDEIIDPVMEDELDAEAIQKLDLVALQTKYDIKATTKPQTEIIKTNMKKQVISALALSTVNETSSDTAVIQAIQDKLTAVTTQANEKDQRIQALEQQIETNTNSMISSVVSEGVKAGKFPEANHQKYENIGKTAGIDTLKAILEDIPSKPSSISGRINNSTDNRAKSAETWDELKKKQGALEKLQAEDFDAFNALYKEKFGKDFNN
ncbi:MAG TPA: Clp protease ClpP, partial [Crocinitomicaceae bacterium]|nr:Clp protease ClpP [Crocinitomicaceae bacterium]